MSFIHPQDLHYLHLSLRLGGELLRLPLLLLQVLLPVTLGHGVHVNERAGNDVARRVGLERSGHSGQNIHLRDFGPRCGLVYLENEEINSLRVSELVVAGPGGRQEELPVVGGLGHGLGVQGATLLPDLVPVPVAVDPAREGGRLAVLTGPGDEVEQAAEGER